MHAIQDPGDPEPFVPPRRDDDDTDPTPEPPPFERPPFERPPFERDPEAQRAPGSDEGDLDNPQPPMQAGPDHEAGSTDEILLDGPGIVREPVGNDNVRDKTVGGVMGGPRQLMGQGQGG
ncbi:MAG TPA: hypothetical protein VNL94_09150 [Candidatus Binatia bacterium]|nr:hypothetical protein [Candidatus Binatia bacterium]